MTDPIALGTKVKGYGKVCAVHWDGTERYYLLHGPKCGVALLPATTVERIVNGRRNAASTPQEKP